MRFLRRPVLLWLIFVGPIVLVLGILVYTLNQTPSEAALQQVLGPEQTLDQIIRIQDQQVVLYHTPTRVGASIVQQSWGQVKLRYESLVGLEEPQAGIQYGFHPHLGLPVGVREEPLRVVQGTVLDPTITTVQVELEPAGATENGRVITGTVGTQRFGVVYVDQRYPCTLRFLNTQQELVAELALEWSETSNVRCKD